MPTTTESPRRLFVSFSGGETSGRMTQWLMSNKAHDYDQVLCLFANSGQEHEATLEFVRQCSGLFGIEVIWIEADINVENPAKSGFKVVDFDSADRSGKVFEDVIKAYGIPNPSWPHCTRELKTRPMTKYLRSIGWAAGTYDTAIGIRADEIDRVDPRYQEKRLYYPLAFEHPTTKPQVNAFWQKQPFRLSIKSYQGNCKWCWKKSLRKHLTNLAENPDWYDFPERMENLYSTVNPKPSLPERVFFRDNLSTADLRVLAKAGGFSPADDDSQIYDDQLSFTFDLDASYGCSESCEIDFTEDAA